MPISVKRYHSGMSGAPVLNGLTGSLITLMDACLINGFNSKVINSASQSGGTATLTTTAAHGYQPYDVVAISGANESVWNDEFRVLSTPDANTLTCAIASSAPIPTGSLSAKIAPLGWNKPFSGINKAAYLPNAQYAQRYLRVLDDATVPTAANGRWTKWRGYEQMTDVDTGTNPSPTIAQFAEGLSVFKSSTSDAVTRIWWLAGDGGIIYFGSFWSAGTPTLSTVSVFGDAGSIIAGDSFAVVLIAGETNTAPTSAGSASNFPTLGSANTTQAGKYLLRANNLQVGSILFGMIGDNAISSYIGNTGLSYPQHPLLFSLVGIVESGPFLRARAMPGIFQPLHTTPLNHLDVRPDLPDFPGRAIQAFDLGITNARGQVFIDIVGPWSRG